MTSSMIWTISLTFSCSLLLTAADAADCQYFAALGERYELPLNVDLKPGDRIKWTWDKTPTLLYDSKRPMLNTRSVTGKKSLIIPKITREDAGFYTWEILMDGRRVNSKKVRLCVLETVSKPKVMYSCVEKKVQFNCSGSQPDDGTYHWFEGGNTIAHETSSLLVRSIEQLGSNSFWCNVSNSISSQTSDPVQQNCLKPQTVSKPKVMYSCDKKQKKVQFTCSGSQPDDVTYHWFEGDKIITTEKSSLLVRSIEQLGSNSFWCSVSNPISSQTSDPVQQDCLKPLLKPTVTYRCDEKKVQFTCSGFQPDDVTYHWFEGGNTIAHETSSLLVRSVEQLGSNSFWCHVSNSVSSQTSDPVQQDCLKPNEKGDRQLFSLDFWLMVGILAGGGLILVFIVVTIVCCCINRRKRQI